MEKEIWNFNHNGDNKRWKILRNSSSFLVIWIAFLLLNRVALLSDVFCDFINTFVAHILNKNHGQILTSINVNQTANVLCFILDELSFKFKSYLSEDEFSIDFRAFFEKSSNGLDDKVS